MPSTDAHPAYLDTPGGLISASGVHFRTTRALLEQFAGPVLEKVSLDTLLERAEVWLRSGQTVALWVLALLLFVLPPVGAALAALTVYLGWETLGLSFVSRRLVAVFRVLEKPFVQAVLYVAVLSYLGSEGHAGAVGVGLAGFVLIRWRVLPLALKPVLRLLRRPLYTLPPPDQVLRAFVLRAALRHNVDLPELEQLKRDLRR